MAWLTLSESGRRRVALAAFGLTTLLSLDAVYQLGAHLHWRGWIAAATAAPVPASQPVDTQPASQTAETQPTTTQAAETQAADSQAIETQPTPPGAAPPTDDPILAALLRRNILAPPVPRMPPARLTGVLGDVALFAGPQGRTLAIQAGQSVGGIKVVQIKGYTVTIEMDGKTTELGLFGTPPAAPDTEKPEDEAADEPPASQPEGLTP